MTDEAARRIARVVGVIILCASGCAGIPGSSEGVDGGAAADPTNQAARMERAPRAMRDALASGRERRVIVQLDERVLERHAATPGPGPGPGPGSLQLTALDSMELRVAASEARYADAKARLLAALPAAGVVAVTQLDRLPVLLLTLRQLDALEALLAHDEVLRVDDELTYEMFGNPLGLINQPAVAAAGNVGAGSTIAILDTGVDYTRTAFGSCSTPGNPALSCKVVYAADIAPNDNSRDDQGHGTNAAGVVMLVAPGAKLVALDVYNGTVANSSDVLTAINWVVANRATYSIVGMNLSMGAGAYSAACPADPLAAAITTAKTNGILATVAAGNLAYTSRIASPACTPDAISVGAVYDSNVGVWTYPPTCADVGSAADQVPCFSNSAWFLSMMAPGGRIAAAQLIRSGTSPAAAHVAGAVAVLRAAFPMETMAQTLTRLTNTGAHVNDPKSAVIAPRLDLAAAMAGVPETTPPSGGTISINSGAGWTASSTVTLATSATDASGVYDMCASNAAGTCTAWVPYAATMSFVLNAPDGNKTVYMSYRDKWWNVSAPVTASILLDSTAPLDGTVSATPGNAQNALSWTGYSDAGSGLVSYKVVYGTSMPASCASGTLLYAGAATSTTQMGLTNGTRYYYRVCGVDAVGNVSSGATASAQPAPEFVPPTGGLSVNNGSNYAATTMVTLNIAATDASGVAQMCVSNTSSCNAWEAYATTKAWTLSGSWPTTVYVWFSDIWNNANPSPFATTIRLDNTAPAGGTMSATPGNTTVSLGWGGFTETQSGIASFKVVYGTSLPADCNAGTLLYAGTSTSGSHAGATNGTTYYYRACAIDNAGNLATGATVSARPLPEFNPPAGSITLNGGCGYANSTSVTLTLSATDASGVSQMCISNTNTCNAWQPYAASPAWTLGGAWPATVYVWFQDAWGNTNPTPYSTTVNLDNTPPTDGVVTASPGNGNVSLSWSGDSDAQSGEASFKVLEDVSPVPDCATGTVLCNGAIHACAHTMATNGTTYYYRVCATDRAGNVSAGATATARPAGEFNPPTGTVTIQSGIGWVASTAVTLHLSATDDTGVAQMCVSNTNSCSAWQAYGATLAWTLSGAWPATVYVWYKDVYNNVMAMPVTATAQLDVTAPTDGILSASPGNGNVSLNWSGDSDAQSGMASWKVQYDVNPVPDCVTGTTLCNGSFHACVHTMATNGTTYYYRVCITDRVGNVSSGVTASSRPAPEFNPPSGSVSIDSGIGWVASASVTLHLPASDASGVAQMCVSNTNSCNAWQAYATTLAWTLPGTWPATVFVWYKDTYNNVTAAPVTATTQLDNTAPTDGVLTASPGNGNVSLNWSGDSDAQSGMASWKVQYDVNPVPDCVTGTTLCNGSFHACVHSMATNGTTYYYRVCITDRVGNVSTGITASSRPAPEFNPPSGSVTIGGGLGWVASTSVTLHLLATDASGVAQMCVSNTNSCSAWQAYGTTLAWTLSGSWPATVYVWYKDTYNNVMAAPVTATTQLDNTAPTDGLLTASPGNGNISLNWSGDSDAQSGMASWKVQYDVTPVPDCVTGTTLCNGAFHTCQHTMATNGTTYYYRVCITDKVGNVSTGVTASSRPAPEFSPPNGSIVINGGAASTNSAAVALTLTATDGSGVAQMCISNTNSCGAWQAYSASAMWNLVAGTGSRTVYVWFSDIWNNVNPAPYTATIQLN